MADGDIELERTRLRAAERRQRVLSDVSRVLLDYGGPYADVTEQRELDRQRSDFLTVAAHELRTPLTPLSILLEMVAKARRQVGRLSRLVEDLLDVSRLDSRRMQIGHDRLDLNDLAAGVVGEFRAESRNHEIVFQRPREPVLIDGDRPRLEQVLVNLLQNALKYSPLGGQVVVRVTRSSGEGFLSVTDPGIGIPLEEQPRLFERFFRAANATTRNYSGLGIGLFVSAEIVRRHAGRFEVKSEVGIGSTFTILLPLCPAA